MKHEPLIHVGILSAPSITFTLTTPYKLNGQILTGQQISFYTVSPSASASIGNAMKTNVSKAPYIS